jgi:hypothetical protein
MRRYFCAKKVQTLNLSMIKFHVKLSYEKAARIMLVKLTQGVKMKMLKNEERKEVRALNNTRLPVGLFLTCYFPINKSKDHLTMN